MTKQEIKLLLFLVFVVFCLFSFLLMLGLYKEQELEDDLVKQQRIDKQIEFWDNCNYQGHVIEYFDGGLIAFPICEEINETTYTWEVTANFKSEVDQG